MICEAGDNRAKRRAMLKRLGLCCNCRKPADGLQFCQECRDRYNATQREKTKARRESRLCIDCEQPAAVGRVRCQKCLDLRKKESGCRPMQAKQKPCIRLWMLSPICLAAPGMSPFLRFSVMPEMIDSTARSASAFVQPIVACTRSIKSALFAIDYS